MDLALDDAATLGVMIGLLQEACSIRIGSNDEALEFLRGVLDGAKSRQHKATPKRSRTW
jgi:hypothetical protein